jgi:hypothetical protein
MPICRHCRQAKANRPRGLCWGCYYAPGIRELYPSTSKFAQCGYGVCRACSHLPPFPTAALPGTPEKIAVLTQRASQGLELWHPKDAPLDRRCVPLFAG